MSTDHITAESAENLTEIEKQWAVKAYDHAETYYKLLCEIEPKTLKLTRIDDEIYVEFRKTFPDMNIGRMTADDINTNEKIKEAWRKFILPFEKRIAHYNFGTLLRLNARDTYEEHNSYFVTRTQFYAIEIARNREGVNDDIYHQYQESKTKKMEEGLSK